MDRLQLLLCKLAEEAAEVSQVALKAQQFGLSEKHADQNATNSHLIQKELTDLVAVVLMLNDEFEFGFELDEIAMNLKRHRINQYAKRSLALGHVTT